MNENSNKRSKKLDDVKAGDVIFDDETGKIGLQRYRNLSVAYRYIVSILTCAGLLFSINEIFRLDWFVYIESVYIYTMMAFFLPCAFLVFPPTKSASRDKVPLYDLVLFLLCIVNCTYFAFNSYRIGVEGWVMVGPTLSVVMSFLLWGLVLEVLRRAGGMALFIFAAVFSLYPIVAENMPGFLFGTGWSIADTAKYHAMSRESIIGIPTRTFCELVVGFMVFSSALQITGGGTFFTKFAMAIFGGVRGGAAKISIVASSLFGSISGSPIANVSVDGWITIPTMKKTGYSAEYAAAVEACASTGGAIMPPVMGAVAFVMASFLQVPYIEVAKAAVIPSLLYYFGLFVQIDAYAAKKGLSGLSKEELPSLKKVVMEGWIYFGALVILVYLLFEMRQEAQAPYLASLALMILAMFKKETRIDLKKLYAFSQDLSKVMIDLVGILTGIGFILGALTMTGVAISFSSELITVFGTYPLVMLIMGMIVSYILGMGMTITACYIILAVVLAPSLTPLGFDVMAVHLFVLYCGLFSFLTPPVAMAAYVAAVIGHADFWKTGWTGMRLAFVLYLVPFAFVYDPNLILHGTDIWATAISVTKTFFGVWIAASAIEGYAAGLGILSMPLRILSFIGGICIFIPETVTDIIGYSLIFVVFAVTFVAKRRNKGHGTIDTKLVV
jgi:TRAP transporter 4TM/12TM fusion protein